MMIKAVLITVVMGVVLGLAWCVLSAPRKIASTPWIACTVIVIETATIASLLCSGGPNESPRASEQAADQGSGSAAGSFSALSLQRE
jgi:hypothetical protein